MSDTKLLIVDDDLESAELLRDALARRGHACVIAGSAAEALERIGSDRAIGLVISDVRMTGTDGLELCRAVRRSRPEVMIILVTGFATIDVAIDAIRAGAHDFVLKPVALDALLVAINRALELQSLRHELRELRRRSDGAAGEMIGDGPAIRAVKALVEQLADNDATILITGESGTGKELVARAIHQRSARRDEPFVAINCAAMPASLLEAELFGYVKGAFTDARGSRTGLIRNAGAGTLFLDEIGEMPLEMQAKLLRTLQARTVRPVGGDEEVPFAARILTATNRDLEEEVREKRFREDLYYRINVVHVAVPPLRERREDILALAHFFVRKIAQRTGRQVDTLAEETAQHLIRYDWPGNVRELENCMERAVALSRTSAVTLDGLPARIRSHAAQQEVTDPAELLTLEQMERRYVSRVLDNCRGNKTRAARILGIDRRSLYRRLDPVTPT